MRWSVTRSGLRRQEPERAYPVNQWVRRIQASRIRLRHYEARAVVPRPIVDQFLQTLRASGLFVSASEI